MACRPRCLLCQALDAREEGRHEDAVSLLGELLRIRPDLREARLLWGQACALTGRVREAIAAFQSLIVDDSGDIEAHLSLASVYLLLGRYLDATRHLKLTATYSRQETGDAAPFSLN